MGQKGRIVVIKKTMKRKDGNSVGTVSTSRLSSRIFTYDDNGGLIKTTTLSYSKKIIPKGVGY